MTGRIASLADADGWGVPIGPDLTVEQIEAAQRMLQRAGAWDLADMLGVAE